MEIQRRLIAIGGGSIAEKTTLGIDARVAELAKKHAGDKRAVGVFIGTASHDSMPYFNSFRKTYTGEFDIKADCVLSVYGEMNAEKIKSKFEKADMLYIGGGDTLYMLEHWKKTGVFDLVIDAYNRGVVVCGLSAGAICWFNKMYTDSDAFDDGGKYHVCDGLGKIDGLCCPHFEDRIVDFRDATKDYRGLIWAIEGNAAMEFVNEQFIGAHSSGGKAYKIQIDNAGEHKELLTQI